MNTNKNKSKLMIYYSDQQNKYKVGNSFLLLLRHAVQNTLIYERVFGRCELSVTFIDNDGIQELNKKYRSIDRPTDVLSFPLIDYENDDVDLSDDSYKMLGDIVISFERAFEQAKELEHSFEHEVAFLCVHSTLHLLGYDHELGKEAEKIMFSHQRDVIETLKTELDKFDQKQLNNNIKG